MPVFLGLCAVNRAQAAPAPSAFAKNISSANLSAKVKMRLAQRTQDSRNEPAAAPQENPRGLEVPVGPDQAPPDSAPAAPPPDAPTAVPRQTAPAPDTVPEVPAIIGDVAAAEGREISDVRVVGNRIIAPEIILGQVRTQRGAAFSGRQIELDRGRIDQLGFFATVQVQVTPDPTQTNRVTVTFIVQENRVVLGYKFVNSTLLKDAELVPILTSRIGAVLNRNTVNTDVAALQKLYSGKGYAVLVESARLDDAGNLVFTLQEARISRVELAGLKKTRPGLIRRQIRLKSGDVFDAAKMRRDLNRIYDLGFFDDVSPKVDDDPDAQGTVIVTYQFTEKRTGQLSFGIGFDSRSKISGFASVQDSNLRGSGKRALASVETGGQRNYELSYGDPFVGARNASYDLSIYNRTLFREPNLVRQITGTPTTDTGISSFVEERTGGRINFSNPLDVDRTRILLFGYRNESAKLFQRDTNGILTPPVTASGAPLQSSGRVSAASIGFLRDKRDSRLDPSRGGREQFIVEQGLQLLGNTQFTKLDVDVRRYFPLMKGAKVTDQPRLIFAGRVVLGRSLNQLPAFEQYYIGGSDTVRGYETDAQFGDNQFYTNLELRYRLQSKIQIVGFVDAGTAFGGNFSSNISSSALYSFGAGLRLQSPIGPIRLDVGRGKNGVKTHFGIGPTF